MKKFLLFSFLLSGISAFAGDWYVATNGTGAGTSWANATNNLQGAITACASNYTVWVSNGTYNPARLTIGGGVTVRSKTGIATDVVFNASASYEDQSRVATLEASSWVIGVTLSGGWSGSDGGGIAGGSASNCIVSDNSVEIIGSGAGAAGCKLYNCLITANHTGLIGGGGIYCSFYNCTIAGNSALYGGGGTYCSFYNCLIVDNSAAYGGGGQGCSFYNCTLVANTANFDGGGGYDCTVVNSISWDNSPVDSFSGSYSNYYSCGVVYTGTGSITNNPLFVSGSDFRLQSNSPCINMGADDAWPGLADSADLDGKKRVWPQESTVDMGAYEYGIQYPVFGVSID